ncbi:SET and MYND domain-containing protein 4-like [Prorops nasuta]|uniref:SET and MYND domain-containing protein 4-like n=1 Tax=Prorops nasuta TaxID=863751 RepID=UPI0034CD6405
MEEGNQFYRTLCSSETVRSGKKGFFHEFSDCVMENVGETWITRIFGRLENDEDRIRTVFTDGKIKDVVVETLRRVKPFFRDKDVNISRCKRLEGYQLATAGQYEKALVLFSQSVLRAPPNGTRREVDQGYSLTLALVGRAEVFMAIKEYHNAMEDLAFAADGDLPTSIRKEIQQKMEASKRCINEMEKALVPAASVLNENEARSYRLPSISVGRNPKYPHASVQLEIQETHMAGKQAVATMEINPGDVLVVEPPQAGCLLPEFYGTHCQQCFSRLRAPVGCPNCSSVAFCTKKCRDLAISTFHKYECKILALLIGSGMSILSALALRMVTQEGLKNSMKIHALVSKRSEAVESTGDSVSSIQEAEKLSKSAKRRLRKKKLNESKTTKPGEDSASGNSTDKIDVRVYDLVMHHEKRSSKDFLERSLMAAFLLKCLQRVHFFENTTLDTEVPGEEEIAVGSLLLKNLQLLQFNAHEIFEMRLGSSHRFRGSRPVYLGVAIYPTVARFNHDCYPAVTRYFVGTNIVIRATRSLKPGDVVAENYGPIFTKRNRSERQRTLAGRYWFHCSCQACQEDWPMFEKLTNDAVRLRCPSKACNRLHPRFRDSSKPIKCPQCRKEFDFQDRIKCLEECEKMYSLGISEMEEENPKQATKLLINAIKKFHEMAVPPHRDTHLAEIALQSCMTDEGNNWKPTF